MKLQIVKFKDNTFAVRRTKWFMFIKEYEYVSSKDDIYWWPAKENLRKWFVVETIEEARYLVNNIKESIKKQDGFDFDEVVEEYEV